MDLQRRCLGIGSVMIVAAVILRLLSAGAWQTIGAALESPETAAFLLYLETGRIVHPQPEPLSTEPSPTTLPTTVPTEPVDAPVAVPCFGPMDAALVDVRYHASYRPDLQQMVTSTLRWDLCADEPTVLILSSHATESYDPKAEPYTASGAYRTLDTERNMISIGSYVADLLENAGIHVIHDTTPHDYPSYNDSYIASRKTVQQYLKQYPTIRLVLDLHRDATDENAAQLDTSAVADGQESAQLMLVVGTRQEGWQSNMALAVKLTALLEKQNPGITRPISFRTQRFNQDLSPGALLVEVGAAGNTRQEALTAAEMLAKAIIALSKGANY
jgi:stage II sporulation protein P